MISILVYIAVSTIAGMGIDSPPQSLLRPDVSRTIGVCASFEYLHTSSSNYTGFSMAGFFRPITWAEVGVGYLLLANNDNRYSYVNSWVGLYSPKLWRIQFTGGAACDLRIPENPAESHYEDPLLQSGISLFAGLDTVLKDSPEGFQYNLRTRAFFSDNSIGRISAGCYILN